MDYTVIAYDAKDEEAYTRRMNVRENHLALARELTEKGKWKYAAGLMDDNEKLIGSVIICTFNSKEEMQKEWLDKEPYIVGSVWGKITIHKSAIPPFIK